MVGEQKSDWPDESDSYPSLRKLLPRGWSRRQWDGPERDTVNWASTLKSTLVSDSKGRWREVADASCLWWSGKAEGREPGDLGPVLTPNRGTLGTCPSCLSLCFLLWHMKKWANSSQLRKCASLARVRDNELLVWVRAVGTKWMGEKYGNNW